MSYYTLDTYSGELYHFGVKGQKHGKRRWQNADGSLTPEGYIHYGYGKRDKKTGKVIVKDKYNKKLERRQQYIDKIYNKYEERAKKKGKINKYTKGAIASTYDSTHNPKYSGRAFVAAFIGGVPGMTGYRIRETTISEKRLKKDGMYYTKAYMKQQQQKKKH